MTTGRSRGFAAWALPSGVVPPPGPEPSFEVGERTIRYAAATPEWVASVVEALRGARGTLLDLPVSRVVTAIGEVGSRLLDPGDELRLRALDLLPATSGLSAAMAMAVLDGMASDWTAERLRDHLDVEMDGGDCLDGFVEGPGGRKVRAMGPELLVQIVSGTVPGVGATALVRSLLVKAPTLVKPGRGDVVLPVLLAEGLRESDPLLADGVAVAYWPGGEATAAVPALQAADVVTVYGGDESVEAVRRHVPVTSRFVPYHHRVSLGVVGRDSLTPERMNRTAHEVAGAVSFFDQRGCVSPQVLYVEEGAATSPASFARGLAEAFADLERTLPGGALDAREASDVHQVRGTAELMAGAGSGIEVHHGGSASWTVIYDPHVVFAPSCVGRVVRVGPVAGATDVPGRIASLSRHLQTVAVTGLGERISDVAEAFARVGVTRVADYDAVPFPPPWWHHDGVGALRALVRWVDLEA